MKSKKYAAAVVSTSGRAGSKRRVVSQRMLPRARARKEVCDQRGGGGVREQRRHCHGVGWEEGEKKNKPVRLTTRSRVVNSNTIRTRFEHELNVETQFNVRQL